MCSRPSVSRELTVFITCLEPAATASRLLGLETFTITTVVQEDGSFMIVFKRSIRVTVYTVTIVIVMLSTFVIFLYRSLNEKVHFAGSVIEMSQIIIWANTTIASSVVLIVMCLNNRPRQEILHRFMTVDKILVGKAGERYRKWSKSSKLFLMCGFLMITIASGFYLLVFDGLVLNLMMYVGYVRDLIIVTMVASYVNVVLLVRQRYILLNTHLYDIFHKEQAENFRAHRRNISEHPYLLHPERLKDLMTNIQGLRNTAPNTSYLSCTENILAVRIVYNSLSHIVSLINSSCGVLVLFTIFSGFIQSIFSLFVTLTFTSTLSEMNHNFYSKGMIAILFLSTAIYVSEAMLIIWVRSSTARAARITGDIVQDLLLKPGIDEEARVQLKEFSDQISSKELVFTAADFFTLDLSIIPSMAGHSYPMSLVSCSLILSYKSSQHVA
ncbi:hypothetical protein PR048_026909 [Dryococelus australis]|uniref:Gustatory receptor n=1 Tax=Dryococelus australis TaxID=614101 RepID=A0ABQ9GMP0_9NEOP|nr:hypothetical protein PR048_026909 [Dryococelus australis]